MNNSSTCYHQFRRFGEPWPRNIGSIYLLAWIFIICVEDSAVAKLLLALACRTRPPVLRLSFLPLFFSLFLAPAFFLRYLLRRDGRTCSAVVSNSRRTLLGTTKLVGRKTYKCNAIVNRRQQNPCPLRWSRLRMSSDVTSSNTLKYNDRYQKGITHNTKLISGIPIAPNCHVISTLCHSHGFSLQSFQELLPRLFATLIA